MLACLCDYRVVPDRSTLFTSHSHPSVQAMNSSIVTRAIARSLAPFDTRATHYRSQVDSAAKTTEFELNIRSGKMVRGVLPE